MVFREKDKKTGEKKDWRWKYVVQNGKTIADSGEGYVNKADCLRGIEIMKNSKDSPIEFDD